MAKSRYWKPEQFILGIRNWLAQDYVREQVFEGRRQRIQAFLDSPEINGPETDSNARPGPLSFLQSLISGTMTPPPDSGPSVTKILMAMEHLGGWYLEAGVSALYDGDDAGYELLSNSFDCFFCAVLSGGVDFARRSSERRVPSGSLRDLGLALGLGIALGRFEDAALMGNHLLRSIREGWVHSTRSEFAGPFLIRLFCDWRRVKVPNDVQETLPDCFGTILKTWKKGESAFDEALYRACDFHAENARSDTNDRQFDFNRLGFRLFPVEILSVLRLRQLLGLPVMIPDHPVTRIPSFRFSPLPAFQTEPLIADVFRKAAREFGISTWEIETPADLTPNAVLYTEKDELADLTDGYVEELKQALGPLVDRCPERLWELLVSLAFTGRALDFVRENLEYLEEPFDVDVQARPEPTLVGKLVELAFQGIPAALTADWRFDPGEKVEAVADRLEKLPDLQPLGIELDIDREDDYETFVLTVSGAPNETKRFRWARPDKLTQDEFFAALAECLPDGVEILAFRKDVGSDTSNHLVVSTGKLNELRETLVQDFEKVFYKPEGTVRFQPL